MLKPNASDVCDPKRLIAPGDKNIQDLEVQLVLALILGCTALIVFCVRLDSFSLDADSY